MTAFVASKNCHDDYTRIFKNEEYYVKSQWPGAERSATQFIIKSIFPDQFPKGFFARSKLIVGHLVQINNSHTQWRRQLDAESVSAFSLVVNIFQVSIFVKI
jgi:hypothetical protein